MKRKAGPAGDKASAARTGSPLTVTSFVHEIDAGTWSAEIEFERLDGTRGRLRRPLSMLRKPELIDELIDRGFLAPSDRDKVRALQQRLVDARPKKRQQLTRKPGWPDGSFGAYAFPDGVVGDRQGLWVYEPKGQRSVPAQTSGSLKGWRRRVAKPALHSPYLTFGLSAAFGTLLLGPTDVESGGFHLHSRSSVGKTLSLRVAGSVFGPAGRADLGNWKSSDAGLEDLAVAHNDRLLCLDEVGRSSSDAREVGKRARELAFLIAGERGRELSASYTGGSPASWRLQLLSTGEQGIAELARLGGAGRLKGEEARLIDVPVEDHPELGIFRGLPEGCESSAALVAALEEACGRQFGHAGRAFVERFSADPVRWREYAAGRMDFFYREAGVPGSGWERRFGKRFALAYAGARLAIKFGILPWEWRRALDAVRLCYEAARGAIPDTGARIEEALARLREGLDGEGKLADLRPTARKRPKVERLREAVGFRKTDAKAGDYVAVRRDAFEALVAPLPFGLVLDRLKRDGLLLTTSRRSPWKQVLVKRLGAKKLPCACISVAFIAD